MVEALNVEEIVQAVKTVKSGTVASSKELETKSQCSEFPYLRHLVVIEGTMILNIRYYTSKYPHKLCNQRVFMRMRINFIMHMT